MADTSEVTVGSEEMNRVIARVQKMLTRAKAGRGASEAEAETAMRLAQDLMSKYNLDMAQIEAASTNTENATERVKEEAKGRAMYKWQQQLAKYVAEANFCYHLIKTDSVWVQRHWSDEKPSDLSGRWERFNDLGGAPDNIKYVEGRRKVVISHIFVGRKANVITAQLMYQYLTQAIEDAVPVENNAQRLSRSAMSWKEGCADRLCERLAQKRKDLIEKHDAAVKAEQERINKEHSAKHAKAPRQLEGNKETEVKAAVAGMTAGAYDETGHATQAEPQERPEADKEEWNPADAAEQPAPVATTAMVLASVYDDKEREANWEVAHDLPPGWLASRRAEREKQEAEAAASQAKQQMSDVEKPIVEETEKQKQARERRAAEEQEKKRKRWAREDAAAARREAKAWQRKDHTAYFAGAEKGSAIGIDVQVGNSTDTKRLKA